MSKKKVVPDLETNTTSPERSGDTQAPPSRFWSDCPEGWELIKGTKVYDVNPNPDPESEPNTYIEMDALSSELPIPEYFGERKASEYSGKTFTSGDTLFARITPCTENGKSALVPQMDTEVGIGSTEYAVLSPKEEKLNRWYLYYLVNSHPVHDYAVSRMRGSTGRQRVPFSVFRNELEVLLPPLEEQRKIASVLYNIDQAIQKTEETINRTNQIKKALIQEFYSKGLYEHKHWQKVDKQDAYMMTRADKLPSGWKVEKSGGIAEVKTGHTPSTSVEKYWNGGIPWVDIHDLTQLEGNVIKSTDDTITEEGLRNSGAKLLPAGTLVLCRTGAIGETAILGRKMATDQDQVTFECDEDKVLPKYLMYLFEYASPQLERLSAGSTHDKIQLHFFSDLKIPLPTLDEQKKIVAVIESADHVAQANKAQLDNLARIKSALNQDLLTGKVRTKDKPIEILEDVQTDS